MTRTARPRRLRADAARNRQALVDAAERLFAERGLAVTLDDIASAAGVNVATAYRNFANKHELAEVFLQQKVDQAVEVAERSAAAEDPWQGLVDFLTGTLELLRANRGLHDVFAPDRAAERHERLDNRIAPAVDDLLARGKRAGVVRAELEAGDLGVVLQMLASVGDIPTDDQPGMLRRYLALLLASLRPTGETLPGAAPSPAQAREALARPRPRTD